MRFAQELRVVAEIELDGPFVKLPDVLALEQRIAVSRVGNRAA